MTKGICRSWILIVMSIWIRLTADVTGEIPELRDVRLRVLSWSGTVEGVLLRKAPVPDAEWVPVLAVDYVRSSFVEVKTGPDLVFFRWEEQPDGTRVAVEDGRVKVEGLAEPFLILITAQRGGGRTYQALSESLEDFPSGAYRFFNASQSAVVVRAGETRQSLPAGRIATLVPVMDGASVGVLIQLAGMVDGEPRLVYSNRLARRENQRLLFFIRDAHRGRSRYEVKRISDSTRHLFPGAASQP